MKRSRRVGVLAAARTAPASRLAASAAWQDCAKANAAPSMPTIATRRGNGCASGLKLAVSTSTRTKTTNPAAAKMSEPIACGNDGGASSGDPARSVASWSLTS